MKSRWSRPAIGRSLGALVVYALFGCSLVPALRDTRRPHRAALSGPVVVA